MTRIDTWTGDQEVGRLATNDGVDASKLPTYRDVRLPADPVERGAPVANLPKPAEARWVIGFEGMEARPYANLHCTCNTFTHFELAGTGVAPVAHCCKNAPPYPQDRKHTAHLLATRVVPNALGGGVVAQPGFPLEPGTEIGAGEYRPKTDADVTLGDTFQFIERLVKADLPSAAATGAAIDAAQKAAAKKK